MEKACRELEREMKAGGAWERLPDEEQDDLLQKVDRLARRLDRLGSGAGAR